jgi:hypothetical protein
MSDDAGTVKRSTTSIAEAQKSAAPYPDTREHAAQDTLAPS